MLGSSGVKLVQSVYYLVNLGGCFSALFALQLYAWSF